MTVGRPPSRWARPAVAVGRPGGGSGVTRGAEAGGPAEITSWVHGRTRSGRNCTESAITGLAGEPAYGARP